MTDINPELIEKAAQALHDLRSLRSMAFHEVGQPLGDTVYADERRADARAALFAVADDIRAEAWAEGKRAALRQADWEFGVSARPFVATNPYRKDNQS